MGATFHLRRLNGEGGEVVYHVTGSAHVGRASENEIVLDEEGVSRRHLRLDVSGGALQVTDLDSTNGVFVNGQRIRAGELRDGDELLVGRALLRVEMPPGTDAASTRALGATTIQLALDAGAEYPGPDPAARAPEHLRALCRILETVLDGGSAASLHASTLNALVETLDLDYGAVLLEGDVSAPVASAAPAASDLARRGPSTTVVRHVLEHGKAVLANDPARDRALVDARSLAGLDGVRILAAPIRARGRVLGVLYLAAEPRRRPLEEAELRLAAVVARVLGLASDQRELAERMRLENAELRDQLGSDPELVGGSAAFARVIDVARKAAAADVTILLRGETGTGKEVLAQAVHRWSVRARRPFVAVNCGALPATVVESELFGHEKGAFTGAVERRAGKFEQADGGTLFLDEIGDLALDLQVKLLRVLEERTFFRVGGSRPVRADVRLITATHRDLDAMVQSGSFRADLLYRIRVLEIRLPPLRERLDDILPLARQILARLARGLGRPVPRLARGAETALLAQAWPGNVRELKNTLERALILGDKDVLEAADVASDPVGAGAPGGDAGARSPLRRLEDVELEHIRAVLDAVGWNKAKAADVLGIGRTSVYEKIKSFGLDKK